MPKGEWSNARGEQYGLPAEERLVRGPKSGKGIETVADLQKLTVTTGEKKRPNPTELKKIGRGRYQRIIDFQREGFGILEATKKEGTNSGTLRKWRSRYPDLYAEELKVQNNSSALRITHKKRVTRANQQFAEFRKKAFGYDTFWHHQTIIDAIEKAEANENNSVAMVLVPPEHGKSSLLEDYICYRVGKDPNIRILLASGRQGQAEKMLSKIKNRMTTPGFFVDTYGPFYLPGQERQGKGWAQNAIKVCQAESDERDFSVECRSITSQVQGARADLILLDDIQSLATLNMSEKLVERVRQEFLSRLIYEGSCVIVGTRVGEQDVYERLQDEELVEEMVSLPAIIDGAEALWPERWPLDKLARKRKQVGEEAWWRNYMQAPRSAGTNPFTQEMVDLAQDHNTVAEPQGMEAMILGLDPALGGGNALVAASWRQDRLTIVDCQIDRGLGRTEEILGRVDDFCSRYRPMYLVVETTALQKGLARDDRMLELSKKWGFSVKEHDTAGIKADPVLGVGSMASSFNRGEVRLAAGDPLTIKRLEPLCTQLLAWRPDRSGKELRQDAVMAMWFVWRWWQSARQAQQNFSPTAFQGRGIPWKATGFNQQTRFKGQRALIR